MTLLWWKCFWSGADGSPGREWRGAESAGFGERRVASNLQRVVDQWVRCPMGLFTRWGLGWWSGLWLGAGPGHGLVTVEGVPSPDGADDADRE